jgi:PKD domain
MRKFLLVLTYLLAAIGVVNAQKHDYNWVQGGGRVMSWYPDYNSLTYRPASLISFNTDTLTVFDLDSFHTRINHHITYSGYNGDFLFCSPGGRIINAEGRAIVGGDSIGVTAGFKQWISIALGPNEYGFSTYWMNSPINGFFIPHDNTDSNISYIQIHAAINNATNLAWSTQTILTRIHKFDTAYQVVSSTPILPYSNYLDDTYDHKVAYPAGIKHANGRDWWVYTANGDSTTWIEKTLITPDSFYQMGKVVLPDLLSDEYRHVGHFTFTHDGTQLIINSPSKGMFLFDLDRCTGDMVYTGRGIEQIDRYYEPYIPSWAGYVGRWFLSCFTHDNRFLYKPYSGALLRYDLANQNFGAVVDTVMRLDTLELQGDAGRFTQPMLAPDGKLYVFGVKTGYRHYVIENPQEPNLSKLIINEVYQTYGPNGDSLPPPPWPNGLPGIWLNGQSFPDYRLGPIDGSPCDTLGINNDPLAAWNYTKYDTIQHIVQFWDLTDYEPTFWYWDFGDGDTSTMQNPQHQYDKGGAYWVCLIVGNVNSADTLCKWVYLPLGTSSNDVNLDWPVSVYPNPTTSHQVTVMLPAAALGDNTLALYDMQGRLVLSTGLTNGRNAVDLGLLSQAHYAYAIRDAMGVVRASGILDVER